MKAFQTWLKLAHTKTNLDSQIYYSLIEIQLFTFMGPIWPHQTHITPVLIGLLFFAPTPPSFYLNSPRQRTVCSVFLRCSLWPNFQWKTLWLLYLYCFEMCYAGIVRTFFYSLMLLFYIKNENWHFTKYATPRTFRKLWHVASLVPELPK